MDHLFRRTQPADLEGCFFVRERTRENAVSRERLAALGITHASVSAGLESGQMRGWVCLHDESVVGFCTGDTETGEVLVLAVLPQYEGGGVGKRLLSEVVRELREMGHDRLWLAASPDSATRAHGFYRSQGWKPRGEMNGSGDEILVLNK